MQKSFGGWLSDEAGASAVEFALTIPLVVALAFAIFHLCFIVYAKSSLHWAVEQSARCAAISAKNPTLVCGTQTATKTYAFNAYQGPNIGLSSASFTPVNDTTNKCRRVSGSGTYHIRAILINFNTSVSAQACFPTDTSIAWPA